MNNLHILKKAPSDNEWSAAEIESGLRDLPPVSSAACIDNDITTSKALFGQWRADPGTFKVTDHPHLEYCRVLEGELRATDTDGNVQHFVEGDSFVIPKGYCGLWEIIRTFRKEVVVFRELS